MEYVKCPPHPGRPPTHHCWLQRAVWPGTCCWVSLSPGSNWKRRPSGSAVPGCCRDLGGVGCKCFSPLFDAPSMGYTGFLLCSLQGGIQKPAARAPGISCPPPLGVTPCHPPICTPSENSSPVPPVWFPQTRLCLLCRMQFLPSAPQPADPTAKAVWFTPVRIVGARIYWKGSAGRGTGCWGSAIRHRRLRLAISILHELFPRVLQCMSVMGGCCKQFPN